MKLDEAPLCLESTMRVTIHTEIFQVKLQIQQLWMDLCPTLKHLSKFCCYVLDSQAEKRKLASHSKLVEILPGDRILYVWLNPPTVAQELNSKFAFQNVLTWVRRYLELPWNNKIP